MSDKNTEHPEEIGFNNYHPADFKIVAGQTSDYGRCYRIGIWAHRPNGDYYAASDIQLQKIESPEGRREFIPDALQITPEQAQELMNSLWDAGLRPDKAKLKKLQVGALENHLSDMQKLSFQELLPMLREAISTREAQRQELSEELERLTKVLDSDDR